MSTTLHILHVSFVSDMIRTSTREHRVRCARVVDETPPTDETAPTDTSDADGETPTTAPPTDDDETSPLA